MRKAGVLSAVALALLVAAAAGGSEAARVAGAVEVDLELILAVDVSGSIDEDEGRLQREGYLHALTDPGVIRAIQAGRRKRIAIAYVEWAGYRWQRMVADWTLVQDAATARALAGKIKASERVSGPFTSLSGIIDYSVPLFGKAFKGNRQVIDISGDGPNNRGRPVALARDQAVAKGIVINGLPIVNERPNPWGRMPMQHLDLYYRNCVIGGRGAFMVVARDFPDFARAVRRKLILEIVGLTPPERPVLVAAAQPSGVPHCDAFLRPTQNYEDY
ncbi:MAG: DUF1194 domain-containing protein [Candidatus Tectomicrobia bacterium]|nr:DUF1194 domain-containing protein [Candidatus Tectomicrobia bacterium]